MTARIIHINHAPPSRWGQIKGARIELSPADLVTPVEPAKKARRAA